MTIITTNLYECKPLKLWEIRGHALASDGHAVKWSAWITPEEKSNAAVLKAKRSDVRRRVLHMLEAHTRATNGHRARPAPPA